MPYLHIKLTIKIHADTPEVLYEWIEEQKKEENVRENKKATIELLQDV